MVKVFARRQATELALGTSCGQLRAIGLGLAKGKEKVEIVRQSRPSKEEGGEQSPRAPAIHCRHCRQ